ncbi:P-loop NTPase fold protein [Reichenbachiella sp. MSK19-1]|uniref:KAP family P-loop NTPase fold protein n=1 Tax=Reichenbachiella sp. MSK19-1 TaxID=1897631 RepID=UPI000E6C8683|nr:P-loop NTPase fold protein [Reichenbachiella sp. MSK19-1]RJE72439.1 hypothetical protein BGP76_00165 [Reichenbachiella sp. MSK19-1]
MMIIKHRKTGEENKVYRETWEKEPGEYSPSRNEWDIIDEGEPVILIELLPENKRREIRIMDKDLALKIARKNLKKYTTIDLDEGETKPIVPLKGMGRIDTSEVERDVNEPNSEIDSNQIPNDKGLSPVASLSDEILLFLLKWRKERDSNLKFWLRQQDSSRSKEKRLSEGQWFQGSGYIFVGFTKIGDVNMTQAIGFVVNFKEGQISSKYLELAYRKKGHSEKLVKCFDAIAQNFVKILNDKKQYIILYDQDSWQRALTYFLTVDKPKIYKVIESNDLSNEFEIPDDKFSQMLSNTLKVREKLGYKPIEWTGQTTDKTASFWSDAAAAADEDELGRKRLVKSVTQSVNELFVDHKEPYTILLNGEWGSGKSSMLNFFEEHLKESGWEVIQYNAWENQRFKDPWWILINQISKYASDKSLSGEFSSHRYWKFKLQYRHKLWAFLLIAVFVVSAYFFSTSFSDPSSDSSYDIGFYTSLIGLVGTFVGVITGLVNNFFFRSVSREELKKQFTEHPFEPIRKRFNQIAEDNDLAIFIDDLDRCDVEATVSLLEGIQNLFKDRPVLYIIAADGRWVSNCFSQKYRDFKCITNDGCTVGDKFLQKTFQLTLNVPKPDPDTLKSYWDNLIGHVKVKELDEGAEPQERPTEEVKKKDEGSGKNQKMDEKMDAIHEDIRENIEKYLQKFLEYVVPDNPRQMKRFINQYEVARKTLIVEGKEEKYAKDEQSDKLVKYLIFSISYPSIADRLKKGEITKEDILDAKKESKVGAKPVVNLTPADRSTIKGLLEGIDTDMIKDDFYSL